MLGQFLLGFVGRRFAPFGDAEVEDLYPVLGALRQDDVVRLEIAMDDAERMRLS